MDGGKRSSEPRMRFVSFEPRGQEYVAFIALEDAFADSGGDGPELRKTCMDLQSPRGKRSLSKTTSAVEAGESPKASCGKGRGSSLFAAQVGAEGDLDDLLSRAARLYGEYVEEIRSLIAQADQMKKDLVPVPASLGWRLGDAVFRLKDKLEEMLLEVDDLYSHLERDTGIAPAFLKGAVSFRRYLPDPARIPCDLTWNRCKRAPRRAALQIERAAVAACGDRAEKPAATRSEGEKEQARKRARVGTEDVYTRKSQ
ncbi:MAG TPA: hypothetical protein GX510_04465 [Firmicutes bacterium]|nr:hypothetical protein [Candidatus Fermentithermobacillaceae bacterium]